MFGNISFVAVIMSTIYKYVHMYTYIHAYMYPYACMYVHAYAQENVNIGVPNYDPPLSKEG